MWVSKHCGGLSRPDLKPLSGFPPGALPPYKPSSRTPPPAPTSGIFSGGYICSNLSTHLSPIHSSSVRSSCVPRNRVTEGSTGIPAPADKLACLCHLGIFLLTQRLCSADAAVPGTHCLALLFSSELFRDTLNSFPAPLSISQAWKRGVDYGPGSQNRLDSTLVSSTWGPRDLSSF